jgi:hypothetical protein
MPFLFVVFGCMSVYAFLFFAFLLAWPKRNKNPRLNFFFSAPKARKTANKINSSALPVFDFFFRVFFIPISVRSSLYFKHYFVFAGFSALSPLKEIRPFVPLLFFRGELFFLSIRYPPLQKSTIVDRCSEFIPTNPAFIVIINHITTLSNHPNVILNGMGGFVQWQSEESPCCSQS